MASDRLQPGIYFRSRQRPAPCYRLVLLDASRAARPDEVGDALRAVHEMLGELTGGRVRGLEGQPAEHAAASAEQFTGLQHLLAFGRRLFDDRIHEPPLAVAPRPEFLAYLAAEGPFPALRWANECAQRNRGEADIAIQLTGERQAAVNCAAVEIWKLLTDLRAPLRVVRSFGGFGRHDGRGWLEFHDGVSNIEASQRSRALEAPADPAWIEGGTYMTFLRLGVELAAWRTLTRDRQELIVGRDKLSGRALTGTARDASGHAKPVVDSMAHASDPDRAAQDYIDPPQTTDPIIEASHIHRANQSRGSPAAAAALRIFRQGYDFLDGFDESGPRLGLNFVSFQRDLSAVQHVLHLPGWLGDANFGGPTEPGAGDPPPLSFIRVLAGGFYAVPPMAAPFPGADIFSQS